MHTKAPTETLSVHASAQTISRYRQLLRADWTATLPGRVLGLLWSIFEPGEMRTSGDLRKLLDPKYAGPFPDECFEILVERIGEGTRFVRRADLPKLPDERTPMKKPSIVQWQAARLTAYLTLPAHVDLTGNTPFFADLQALAFQAALHFTLPALRDKHPAEHAILLHAATLFCLGYAVFDPGHDAYMMSQIYDYLGDGELRLRSLYASFRFTPPQDHSYLTKAQEYWMALLDDHRNQEAEQFLFSLPGWSLPDQQEEVRGMIADAYRQMVKSNHRDF